MSSQWSGGQMPLPEGETPDYDNPPDQMTKEIAVHSVFITFSTIALIIRVYTRLRVNKMAFGIDDYLAVLAWITAICFTGVLFTSMSWGMGRHIWDVPPTWMVHALKYQTISSWLYLITATLVKLSFMFLYRRLFTLQRPAKILVNGGIIVCGLLNLGLWLGLIFFCIPVQKAWDNSLEGHCQDPATLSYLTGAVNVFFDIYVLLIPVPLVWRLNMGTKRKMSLAAIFGTGIFACVASIVRLAMTPKLQSDFDSTWNLIDVSTWATMEIHVGLICCCFLLLPAFLRHHLPERTKARLRNLTTKKGSGQSTEEKGITPRWPGGSASYAERVSSGSDQDLIAMRQEGQIVRRDSFVIQSTQSSMTDIEAGIVVPPALKTKE